jgi:predicted DNA-binding protein YlxM (UPF0122 family)
MKNQAYRMTMLFDFYGDLLTERQKEFYDLYYNDDLSLAEIAENYDITRQGVRDIIVRAERTLEDVEEKTGLIRRFHQIRDAASRMREIIGSMDELNRNSLRDETLDGLCRQLEETVAELERE